MPRQKIFIPLQREIKFHKNMLNPVQIELLSAMSALKSDADLLALKRALSNFFAERAEAAMEELWQTGEWNEDTLEDLKTVHYRTPYK